MLDPSLYSNVRKIQLGSNDIIPGAVSRVNYNVGNLPSGTRVAIHMEIFRSINPGPHVMVIGGVRGDEAALHGAFAKRSPHRDRLAIPLDLMLAAKQVLEEVPRQPMR